MKDLVIKNVNPKNENTGDCVLRSFTSYFEDELTYEEIKNKIFEIAKSRGNIDLHPYRYPKYFLAFAKEANMVKINVDDKKEFSTGNRLIDFCKNNRINAIGVSNNHAVYVDYKIGMVDTWDSRRKRIRFILINKDDAIMMGAKKVNFKDSLIDTFEF
jgi:hypothetical protein